MDEGTARRDPRVPRPPCTAGAGPARRAHANHRPRQDDAAAIQERPDVLPAHAEGRAAGQALHQTGRPGRAAVRSGGVRSVRQDDHRRGHAEPRRHAGRGGHLPQGLGDPRIPHPRLAHGRAAGPADRRRLGHLVGARPAPRVHLAAHRRGRREAGAAALLPPPAGQRPQGRRAAGRADRPAALLFGLRTGGHRPRGVRGRRLLVEPDPHPAQRQHRRAADDLRQRQVQGQRRLPPRPVLRAHQPRGAEVEAPRRALRPADVRRLAGAAARAEDGARGFRGDQHARSSPSTAPTC